jgi:hypothetical protein
MIWSKSFTNCYRTYQKNTSKAYRLSPLARLPGKNKIRKIGENCKLAEDLWSSAIHEARILACMIDDPQQITADRLERLVNEFDSWDLCDQCCNRLFSKTPFARQKALAWAKRPEEFVKRAGFVLMAVLAVHDKKAADAASFACLWSSPIWLEKKPARMSRLPATWMNWSTLPWTWKKRLRSKRFPLNWM